MTRARALLLVSLAACLVCHAASADPQRRLESARKALEAGDYQDAARDLAKGLDEAREDGAPPSVLLNLNLDLADVYATYPDLGREADAEALYLEARRIAEAHTAAGHNARVDVLRRLGDYYALQGRHEQAIPVLEQFLKEAETAVPLDRTLEGIDRLAKAIEDIA